MCFKKFFFEQEGQLNENMQRYLLLALQSLLIVIVAGEFLEQPGPGPVLIPVGGQAHLSCSVTSDVVVEWSVKLPDGTAAVDTDHSGIEDFLNSRGFIIEGQRTANSTLAVVINNDQTNNGTFVTCVAVNLNTFSRVPGRRVQIIFFDIPATPSDLRVRENGLHSLNISWSLTFIQGVAVKFTLTVINLNTSTTEPVVVTEIEDRHYIFTVADSTSCDVYSFQVTAVNDAGSSNPSEIITSRLPSLPDISPIEESLSHSLVNTADGIQLSIKFQDTPSCSGYPVINYTLVVEDLDGVRVAQSSPAPAIDSDISMRISNLMENSQLRYYVLATNQFGDSDGSVPVEIVTTDVQNVTLCPVGAGTDDPIYSIMCTYLSDSDARGCVYTLVSGVEGVENVTGTIERRDSAGVTLELPNIVAFSSLLAVDLEQDNSTSNVSVIGSISLTQECPITVEESLLIPPGGIVGIVLAAVIILVAIVLTLMVLAHKLGPSGRGEKPSLFAVQRSSGSYTVNDGKYSNEQVHVVKETSIKIDSSHEDSPYAVPSIEKKSPPAAFPPDKFYYQDPSYEDLDRHGPATKGSKSPAHKKDVVTPPTSAQPRCPSGGDSPKHQSPPILEYARVIPRSERKKKQQQQQQQKSGYMNYNLATNGVQV